MSSKTVTLQVNGQSHTLEVPSGQTLLETLRETLDLVGARDSCGIGMCGTCTVLVDGQAISGCLTLTAQVDGKQITTIEGFVAEQATTSSAAGLYRARSVSVRLLHSRTHLVHCGATQRAR